MATGSETGRGRRQGSVAARALAVLALIAAAVIVVAVVLATLEGGTTSPGGSTTSKARHHHNRQPSQPYYVIQSGDTLDAIHLKFHVSIARLEQLNPKLDTQQLPVSGCVNLVPDGCKVLTQGG